MNPGRKGTDNDKIKGFTQILLFIHTLGGEILMYKKNVRERK